jgi:hypothetical protein
MKRLLLCFLCCLMGAALMQAQYTLYAPNSIAISNFKTKNELYLSAGWVRSAPKFGYELQAMYSITKKYLVMANFMSLGSGSIREQKSKGTQYRLGEVGVGLYEAFPRGAASVLLGVGRNDNFLFFGVDDYVRLIANRIFLQPGVTYQDRYFRIGMGIRLNYLNFTEGTASVSIPPEFLASVTKVEKKGTFFQPEMGVNTGLQVGLVFLGVSIYGVLPPNVGFRFTQLGTTLSLGVNLDFSKKSKQ